ncbi:MAG: acyltransferase family protein [Lautropia sp.]
MNNDQAAAPPPRTRFLDSLRGLAAIIVVTAHYSASFLPYAVFGNRSLYPRHWAWEEVFFFFPMSLLTAGHFAVSLFFVLSGYILSIRFLGRKDRWREVLAALIKRPIRLAGLLLLSVAIGGLLWRQGLLFNVPAAEISGSQAWLGSFWKGSFDDGIFLRKLLSMTAGSEYNPPLWTIKIEIVGSFLIFAAIPFLNLLRYRWRLATHAVIILLLHGSYYQGFFIGMLIADLHKHYRASLKLQRIRQLPGFRYFEYFMALAALFFAAYPYYASERVLLSSVYGGLPDLELLTAQYAMVGAMLMLTVFILSQRLRRLISHPLLYRLGNISYAVYVLHFLILGSLVCWLFERLTPMIGYFPSMALACTAGLVVLIPIAVLATRFVDDPSIRLANKLEDAVLSRLRACPPVFGRGQTITAEKGQSSLDGS